MATLRKDVLYVGTVHPPGLKKPITFGAGDLAHYQRRMRDMLADNLQIPVAWEHQGKARPLTPEEREAEKAELVKLTLGHVTGADIDPDGILVNELEVPSEADRQKLPAIRFVSPQIKWDWKDGRGKVWPGPSITHIAVTPRPVQHDQKPFSLAGDGAGLSTLQLSLTDYVNLGADDMADEPDLTDAGDGGSEGAGAGADKLAETVAVLKRVGIVLPDDTAPDNLLERLHTAALTMEHHTGDGGAGDDDDLTDLDGGDDVSRVQQPASGVAMSMLDGRLKATEANLAKMHRGELRRRVESLKDTGRIDRTIYQGLAREAGTVRLSLGADGELAANDLVTRVAAYEALPEGHCWPAAHLSHAGVRAVPPPEGNGPGGSDQEVIDTIAKDHWGTRRRNA